MADPTYVNLVGRTIESFFDAIGRSRAAAVLGDRIDGASEDVLGADDKMAAVRAQLATVDHAISMVLDRRAGEDAARELAASIDAAVDEWLPAAGRPWGASEGGVQWAAAVALFAGLEAALETISAWIRDRSDEVGYLPVNVELQGGFPAALPRVGEEVVLDHPLDPVNLPDAGSGPRARVMFELPSRTAVVHRRYGPALQVVLPTGTRLSMVGIRDRQLVFRAVADPLLPPSDQAEPADGREQAQQHASGFGDGVWEVTSHADEWCGSLPGELPPVGETILLSEEFERDRTLPGGTEVTVIVPPGVPTVRRPGGSIRLPAGTRVLVEGVRFDVGSRVGELVVLLPGDAADE